MAHRGHEDPLEHLNRDHADGLLATVRAFGGHPDASAARAERIDRFGIDVVVDTAGGEVTARVDFAEPIPETEFPGGVRLAFVRLSRRARA